jgi:hypothetical protein
MARTKTIREYGTGQLAIYCGRTYERSLGRIDNIVNVNYAARTAIVQMGKGYGVRVESRIVQLELIRISEPPIA